MNATETNPAQSAARSFWVVVVALFSLLTAGFACFWIYFVVAYEPGLLRYPTATGGMLLLMVGAAYGTIELTHRFRRHTPHIYLPLSALFIVVTFISGGLLIIDGLRARKRSADTRIIEGLRITEDTNAAPIQPPTPHSK
jgi:hypothetical protein